MALAILSSKILTGSKIQPWVEAILIEDGLITVVGSNIDIKKRISSATDVYELPGRLITPGICDAHCHLLDLGRSLRHVDLRNTTSIEACRAIIRKAAQSLNPGEWLQGWGWDQQFWSDKRYPNRHDLDDIVPDNPVIMDRICGHSSWINSKTMKIAGINANTPDPPSGKIDREPDSNVPTGLIRVASDLVYKFIPELTIEQRKQAALDAQNLMLKYGVTQVHSCETLDEYQILAALEKEGKLKLRVNHLLSPEELDKADRAGIGPGKGSDRLWNTHTKFFADGSLGSDTALLHEPYANNTQNNGLTYISKEQAREYVISSYQSGRSVAVHALGDKAVSNMLDAIMFARKSFPGTWRDRIEHAQLIQLRDLDRFKEMDVTASVQPVFLLAEWEMATQKLGLERCQRAYAWKTIIDHGIRTQFGSDAPVGSNNPLLGIQSAITRRDLNAQPEKGWFPDQCLSMEESLLGYSKVAAWTAGKEDFLGEIVPRKWADLTIFQYDLFETPPHLLKDIQVEMTIIKGEPVYRNPR